MSLPVVLAAADPRFLSNTYGRPTVAFELLGFTATLAMAALAVERWRRAKNASLPDRLVRVAPFAVGAVYAHLIGEYPRKPFDYDCYEYAARALRLGLDPYVTGLVYLYPPLTAQVFAAFHAALELALLPFGVGPERIWNWIFYGYECLQLGMVLLAFELLTRFGRGVGMTHRTATVAVTALLIFDNPLWRTVHHGQINLWVLNLSIACLLLARRRPSASGFALALAAHVKIYPLVLGLPLLLTGCWRACFWTVGGGLLILGVSTQGFTDWTVWAWFADFYGRIYPGETAIRNNSLHSLVFNTFQLVLGSSPAEARAVARLTANALVVAVVAWMVRRGWQRSAGGRDHSDATRLALGAEALGFSLLISQSVWEHHYVLALPLLLVAIRHASGREGRVALAALLMIALPTVDLFPVSYHRMVGLVLALAVTAPRRAREGEAVGGALATG